MNLPQDFMDVLEAVSNKRATIILVKYTTIYNNTANNLIYYLPYKIIRAFSYYSYLKIKLSYYTSCIRLWYA